MFKCEICGKPFDKLKGVQSHASQKHNLKSREYYNLFFKTEVEGICECGRKTRYINITKGYHKFCSAKCQSNNREILKKRTKKTKGNKHWTNRYKTGPNKGKTYEEIHGKEKANKLRKKLSKWFLENCVGESNPFFGKHHNSYSKYLISLARKGKTYEEIYGEVKGKYLRKKRQGKKKSEYTTFNYHNNFYSKDLRKRILNEQGYKCAICFCELLPYRKNLHHINYVKKDNRRRNLIYLCVSCHIVTNGKRHFWKKFLKKLNNTIVRSKKFERKFSHILEKKMEIDERQNIILRRI